MSARATYSVQVAWPAIPASAFVLNLSRLGFDDELAEDVPEQFTELSARTKRISIRRGRSDNLDAVSAGEATIVIHDPEGDFNPLNGASPYVPNVIPGRKVIVSATYNGNDYGLFWGFIRSIEHDPSANVKETRLTCQDIFMTLTRAKPTITGTGQTTTGGVVETVLDAIGWDGPTDIAAGDPIANFYSQGENTALSLIQGVLETERGSFFHGKGGTVSYLARHARYGNASSATLTDVATAAAPATDIQNVRNRAKVGNGVYSTTAQNQASISNFGPSDATEIASPYIQSPAQAASLARWLVEQGANPSPPLRSLDYIANKSGALMENTLAREIGERITVTDGATGLSGVEFIIEGMEHQIEAGGTRHAVSFALTQAQSLNAIFFGTSRAVGGTFSSPSSGTAPYSTPETTPDLFVF